MNLPREFRNKSRQLHHRKRDKLYACQRAHSYQRHDRPLARFGSHLSYIFHAVVCRARRRSRRKAQIGVTAHQRPNDDGASLGRLPREPFLERYFLRLGLWLLGPGRARLPQSVALLGCARRPRSALLCRPGETLLVRSAIGWCGARASLLCCRSCRRICMMAERPQFGLSTISSPGSDGEGVAEGGEGRLGMEVGVEGQGALGEAVFAGTEALEPGVAVGQTPGENGFHGFLAKNVFKIAAVDFSDEAIAFGNVRGESLVVDVQFRYVYFQLSFFDF